MHVLLVEDQPQLAQLMAQGLSEAGFAVEVAANGMAAQRFVESTAYDLVILDVMLPGLERLEAAAGDPAPGRHASAVLDHPGRY